MLYVEFVKWKFVFWPDIDMNKDDKAMLFLICTSNFGDVSF